MAAPTGSPAHPAVGAFAESMIESPSHHSPSSKLFPHPHTPGVSEVTPFSAFVFQRARKTSAASIGGRSHHGSPAGSPQISVLERMNSMPHHGHSSSPIDLPSSKDHNSAIAKYGGMRTPALPRTVSLLRESPIVEGMQESSPFVSTPSSQPTSPSIRMHSQSPHFYEQSSPLSHSSSWGVNQGRSPASVAYHSPTPSHPSQFARLDSFGHNSASSSPVVIVNNYNNFYQTQMPADPRSRSSYGRYDDERSNEAQEYGIQESRDQWSPVVHDGLPHDPSHVNNMTINMNYPNGPFDGHHAEHGRGDYVDGHRELCLPGGGQSGLHVRARSLSHTRSTTPCLPPSPTAPNFGTLAQRNASKETIQPVRWEAAWDEQFGPGTGDEQHHPLIREYERSASHVTSESSPSSYRTCLSTQASRGSTRESEVEAATHGRPSSLPFAKPRPPNSNGEVVGLPPSSQLSVPIPPHLSPASALKSVMQENHSCLDHVRTPGEVHFSRSHVRSSRLQVTPSKTTVVPGGDHVGRSASDPSPVVKGVSRTLPSTLGRSSEPGISVNFVTREKLDSPSRLLLDASISTESFSTLSLSATLAEGEQEEDRSSPSRIFWWFGKDKDKDKDKDEEGQDKGKTQRRRPRRSWIYRTVSGKSLGESPRSKKCTDRNSDGDRQVGSEVQERDRRFSFRSLFRRRDPVGRAERDQLRMDVAKVMASAIHPDNVDDILGVVKDTAKHVILPLVKEGLKASADVLEFVPLPGLTQAVRLLLHIWDACEGVKENEVLCYRLTRRCTSMLLCIHGEIKEAGKAVEMELAEPLGQLCDTLQQVKDLIETLLNRHLSQRVFGRQILKREIQRCEFEITETVTRFNISIHMRILRCVEPLAHQSNGSVREPKPSVAGHDGTPTPPPPASLGHHPTSPPRRLSDVAEEEVTVQKDRQESLPPTSVGTRRVERDAGRSNSPLRTVLGIWANQDDETEVLDRDAEFQEFAGLSGLDDDELMATVNITTDELPHVRRALWLAMEEIETEREVGEVEPCAALEGTVD